MRRLKENEVRCHQMKATLNAGSYNIHENTAIHKQRKKKFSFFSDRFRSTNTYKNHLNKQTGMSINTAKSVMCMIQQTFRPGLRKHATIVFAI